MTAQESNLSVSEVKWRQFVVCTFLVLFPFYVWGSGLPKPADMFFILLASFTIVKMFFRIRTVNTADMNLLLFSFLACFINLIHYAFDPDRFFLLMMFVYLYNTVLFFFIRQTIINSGPSLTKTFLVLFAAILLFQIFFLVFVDFGGTINRMAGTFNNPNQLALWGIALFCITLVLSQYRFTALTYVVLTLCTIVIFISLSRTALALIIVLWMVTLYAIAKTRPLSAMLLVSGAIGLGLIFVMAQVAADSQTVADYVSIIEYRFSVRPDALQEVADRGYQRLFQFPHYLLIGAGEGGFHRFEIGLELHSGFVTILFSYGILGFLLFLNIFVPLVKRATKIELACLAILFAFNITHQAVRFSMFWVFLAFLAAAQHQRQVRNDQLQAPRPPIHYSAPA